LAAQALAKAAPIAEAFFSCSKIVAHRSAKLQRDL
jgi:hypothetical protein